MTCHCRRTGRPRAGGSPGWPASRQPESAWRSRRRACPPWSLTHWHIGPPFLGLEVLRWVVVALIVLGLLPLLSSFARFAWDGLGTPAPIAPPTRLVVTGFYRRV